jgi:hypothetical protein
MLYSKKHSTLSPGLVGFIELKRSRTNVESRAMPIFHLSRVKIEHFDNSLSEHLLWILVKSGKNLWLDHRITLSKTMQSFYYNY